MPPTDGLIKVSASAGSGKTYWLVSEIFSLLGDAPSLNSDPGSACLERGAGDVLAQILAITFTNSAAAEMRERMIGRLKEAALSVKGSGAEGSPPPAQAEQWLDNILANYSSLNIRTIDSLLHLIVRASALELGINPDFETSFEEQEIFQPWIDEMFEAARSDPALERELREIYRVIIRSGEFKGFLSHENLQEKIFEVLAQVLQGVFDHVAPPEKIEAKSGVFEEQLKDSATSFLSLAESPGIKLNGNFMNAVTPLAGGEFGKNLSNYLLRDDFDTLYNNKSSRSGELAAAYFRLQKAAVQFYQCREFGALAPALLAVINLAKKLRSRYEDEASGLPLLPSVLVPKLAAKVLKEGQGVADAICRLGTRLRHFLVDEFQDTSKAQWQVLRTLAQEALSSGGSLAGIGDGKQSIYAWRDGDPDIFASLLSDPALAPLAENPALIRLKRNRRSLPEIVLHNNSLFGVLKDPDVAMNVLAYLIPSRVPADYRRELAEGISAIYADVEQEYMEDGDAPGIVECLEITADSAGEIWEKCLETTCDLVFNTLLPRRPPSDIMILCRSQANCLEVASALVARGVPVLTENSLMVGDNPAILQTLAFLRFLNNPADDISFLLLLSGPIVARHPEWQLTREELEGWLLKTCQPFSIGKNARTPLCLSFAKAYPENWKKFFAPFRRDDLVLSAYDIVREWYSWLDVEKRFPKDSTFIRRFLEILHGAEENDFASLGAFLDYWDKSGANEKAPTPENANAVSVMTVHKAKGLQKPVVIVPKTNFFIRASSTLSVLKLDDLEIPVSLGKEGLRRQYYESYGSRALESLNILYVAFTRAEEELYYFDNYKPEKIRPKEQEKSSDKKIKKPPQPSMMKYLRTVSGLDVPATVLDGHRTPNTQTPDDGESLDVKPLPETWRPMDWLPDINIYRAHPEVEDLTAVERGNFMHRCLERLNLSSAPNEAATAAFNGTLRQTPYTVPEKDRTSLLAGLKWFAGLPFSRKLLENGWREQSLITADGRMLRPDLLVPAGDGALVVDYKTGTPEEAHIDQIREYMRVIVESGAFNGNVTGLLIYLDRRGFTEVTPQSATGLLELPAPETLTKIST